MEYDRRQNKYTNKYKRDHYKRIGLLIDKSFYDEILAPKIEKSGLSVNAWIKQAIDEKIVRE